MSFQVIGQIAGSVIGFMVAGPIGAVIGGSLGGAIGSSFDSLPTQYGPRLDDLRVQSSTYGTPIPIVYGTVALQGTVIWAKEIEEVKHEEEVGGGGLLGGPSQTVVTYEYFGTFAVAVCEGPIRGILRIWAGPEKRLIYDGISLEGGIMRMYLGDEIQMPDPLIGAPAYRGTAYVVLEHFPLKKDGNRLPFLTIEVSTGDDGGTCGTDYTMVGGGRLYDVPPVKLGTYGAGPADADRMFVSDGEHPTAVDKKGNLYVLVYAPTPSYRWYVKKVSTTSPITEDLLYLGPSFSASFPCSMAYDPSRNVLVIIQENETVYANVNCTSFELFTGNLPHAKSDIIYSEYTKGICMLNSRTSFTDGLPDPDNYGLNYIVGSQLIDCGHNGIAVRCNNTVYLDGMLLANKSLQIYDPIRDRLLAVGDDVSWGIGYYDFKTGELVTPTSLGTSSRKYPTYFPLIDRIVWADASGLTVMNPADFTTASFPNECQLFGAQLVYGDGSLINMGGNEFIPVPLPNSRGHLAVINSGNWSNDINGNDIFTFALGARGAGVSLASVVADLSERAGESRYDVTQLASDTVDGYVIARQTQVRAAIDTLRSAYYFDAVESQGVIKYVKRGGNAVAEIEDTDLGARDASSEPAEPLQTVRRMEFELPRAITVKYLLAADDYNPATKQARRLIGASGNEKTIEVPLVLTDTKGQEVAEVNLHAEWAERLSYSFTLPHSKYPDLEPTDIILVKGHSMRLTKIKATPRGVLECEALADESKYYTPHVVVTETPPNEKFVATPGITTMELF